MRTNVPKVLPMADEKSLVLVIGAGASKEVGLPIGDELKNQIASVLNFRFKHLEKISGDKFILQAIHLIAAQQSGGRPNIAPYIQACEMIRDAMPQAPSIDNFINAHRGNEKIVVCGKLAIARCILDAEARSKMRVDRSNFFNKMDFKALESKWYALFFYLLVENEECQLQDIPGYLRNIAIIDFNYDRCFESYLHAALMNYYRIQSEEAEALMSSLRIFRPYGSLGCVRWNDHGQAINFGASPNSQKLIEIARELKTFTEGTDETHSEIAELRATLQSAKRIAFLGFGFNEQNLNLLYGPSGKIASNVSNASVFATAFGISESNVDVISGQLSTMGGYRKSEIIMKRDLTCFQLLQDYSRSLAIR